MEEEKKRGRGRPPKSATTELATAEETKPVKKTRNRPDLANFGQENVQPGDNSKYLRHALATLNMPPIDISNAHQVSERIGWYFNHCADSDMKPTVNGMCNALGIHRDTLHTWRTGEYRADSHQAIVMKAYRVLEELWEDYMLNGKINPVSGIFLSKNLFYGYADKQEFVLTPNSGLAEADAATIAAKYEELPE